MGYNFKVEGRLPWRTRWNSQADLDWVLDDNADQTLWQLNCGDDFVIERIERNALHNNVDERVKLCLCPVERTFGIFDTGYNGICFQHGQGYYNLFIEGREVYIGAE